MPGKEAPALRSGFPHPSSDLRCDRRRSGRFASRPRAWVGRAGMHPFRCRITSIRLGCGMPEVAFRSRASRGFAHRDDARPDRGCDPLLHPEGEVERALDPLGAQAPIDSRSRHVPIDVEWVMDQPDTTGTSPVAWIPRSPQARHWLSIAMSNRFRLCSSGASFHCNRSRKPEGLHLREHTDPARRQRFPEMESGLRADRRGSFGSPGPLFREGQAEHVVVADDFVERDVRSEIRQGRSRR